MKKVTVKDFRIAVLKVTESRRTTDLLKSLSDDELFNVHIERDLHVFPGKIGDVIQQIGKDKRVALPHELHKVLSDGSVSTLVNTVNLCIQEEEKLGLNAEF